MSVIFSGAPTKEDLVKIHDYLWEIPKSFRPDMRVPARIYASEKMLDLLFKDRSLWQLINLTTLPGVHKYAFVMPDVHEGYGSPVGGIAAPRTEDGIISPGMCVQGDAKVLHPLGYYTAIKNFETDLSGGLACANFSKKRLEKASIVRFFKLKTNPSIYRVVTRTGCALEATADHPFYTPQGMIPLQRLQAGDAVAVYPFAGVPYKKPAGKTIIAEDDIAAVWRLCNQDPRGHGLSQILNRLKKNGLLPLSTDSPKFAILLKVMGYAWGDGNVYIGKDKKAHAGFYGKKEDLKVLQKDLTALGFRSVLYSRIRKHSIRTTYRRYQFEREETSLISNSTSLPLLLMALDIPAGNKARQDFLLPQWLPSLPLWQKRLFLAGFFGAELSSPDTYRKHGFNFYAPVLGINKAAPHIKSGKIFLKQIARLLSEFGIKSKKISLRKEQKNKDGSISYRIRLILASTPNDLLALWRTIGYEYHRDKQFRANLAVHYIRAKQQFIETKILARGIASRKGLILWRAANIDKLRVKIAGGGRSLARPFVGQFPTFEQFIRERTVGLGKSGMAWDSVEKIEKIPFRDFVYDFTVAHRDHNFIANSFVVSNCGYDINCGVRLLRTEAKYSEVKDKISDLTTGIFNEVPSGVGRGGWLKLSTKELDGVLSKGASWMVEKEFGSERDLLYAESSGQLQNADPSLVSEHAKNRARDQLGTIGAGNHFVEIQRVDEIFDKPAAKALGLFPEQITILIHCGSRGLGHQVATDYIKLMMQAMPKYKISLVDRELACAPLNSSEGQQYFKAMAAAANYAWANRHLIMQEVRKAWKQIFGDTHALPELIYDVAHNIVKLEEYDGVKVLVHRKGATRAFPPGHAEIPEDYAKSCGQPVFIPGSMGTASFVLVGTHQTMKEAFASSCHGAGRVMSRTKAKQIVRGETLKEQLEKQGISIRAGSMAGLAEEAPLAYKDVETVVDIVHNAGIAKKVARLKPIGVMKG